MIWDEFLVEIQNQSNQIINSYVRKSSKINLGVRTMCVHSLKNQQKLWKYAKIKNQMKQLSMKIKIIF